MSRRLVLVVSIAAALRVDAQVAKSAYRALGQPDLRQNGINLVQGLEMYNPSAIAVDSRDGAVGLYVADTRNHRVLAWRDIRAYQNGDPPSLILGQPNPQSTTPLGIGAKGFNAPFGMAVDPFTGNLYIADTGNSRVLRFPSPFADPSRIEPDAVFGQTAFTSITAGVSRSVMNRPRGVAFDSQGNLWVADTGNHRVLRFNRSVLESLNADADLVVGQRDFLSNTANRGAGTVTASGFDSPVALAFDPLNNLYVSDFSNARVLRFSSPVASDASATGVFGQANFTTRGAPAQASAATIGGPVGLCVDVNGNLFVAVPNESRVLTFQANAAPGPAARDLLGQVDFTSSQANPSSFPYASANTFASVNDVKLDADGSLIVADTGNNRVLQFPAGAKTAAKVWGQFDFRSNGVNRVKPGSLNTPFKIAIDYSQAPFALYASDTNNHRILGWRDSVRFRTGDPADLVIGQPDFDTALPNVDTRGSTNPSRTSLSSPRGIAIDGEGNLWVADSGNNRVLRFPRPTAQSGRIAPDVVLGQTNFTTALSAAVSAASFNNPSAVAVDPEGNIYVSDTGNHRVLQFSRVLASSAPALRVFGQPGFTTGVPSNLPSAQTLHSPQGIHVDAASSLYVADSGAHRVVIFPNVRDAASSGAAAAIVLGQDRFDNNAAGGGAAGLRSPVDVTLDGSGSIYVADSGNHRIVIYPSLLFLPLAGAAAVNVVGQRDVSASASPNFNASQSGLATPEGLLNPLGLLIDRKDTLYVSDSGNSRVLHFLKPASIVHAANTQSGAPLARGGLVLLTGSGLAASTATSESGAASVLAEREVVLNDDLRAPLLAVAPGQIDFQAPAASPLGTVRVAVRASDTGELVAGGVSAMASTSPGLFTNDEAAKGHGRILNPDGTRNTPSNPAARGTTIKMFGTGQGPVSPGVADGEMASADVSTVAVPTTDGAACLNRQPSVCVAIGNTFGEVQFSGLAPQLVGVWQLNVVIPLTATPGTAIPIRAVINGSPSNIVTLAIR